MMQGSLPITRQREQASAKFDELGQETSDEDSEVSGQTQSESENLTALPTPESPLPAIESDVLRLADASRANALEAPEILGAAEIENIQFALLKRMADQLSEQEIQKLQDETTSDDALICWCCGRTTAPPSITDSDVFPVFVVSAMPEWLLPALHCGNLDCSGRELGLLVKPKYGDGMSFDHAGLLIALHIQKKWRTVSWFLNRDDMNSEILTEVDSGLTLRRATLALLFRIMKPYDDFIQEKERRKSAQNNAKEQVEDDKSDQENICSNPCPNLPIPVSSPATAAEPGAKTISTPLAFEEDRRSLQIEELNGCAKLIWEGATAAGFCTYSVRMDATYGVYAMLNGIYVRRGFRRRGLARKAIQNFFRIVAPAICRKRNAAAPTLMAIQAPVTQLILRVMANSLEPEEMSRIKCVRAQCPLILAASVKSWAGINLVN